MSSVYTANATAGAKSSVGVFTLPCGYLDDKNKLHKEIEVSELTGEQEDLLLGASSADKKINGLLAGCLKRVGDYTEPHLMLNIVKDMLIGDRVALLFAIRRITYTDSYVVKETCPNPECTHVQEHPVNLSEMKLIELEDPMKREFEFTTSDGTLVKYHLPTGQDEQNALSASKNVQEMSTFFLMRIHEYNEIKLDLNSEFGKMRARAVIKSIPIMKRQEIRKILLDKDKSGVDTKRVYVCDACGNEYEKELNTDFSFFFPFLV